MLGSYETVPPAVEERIDAAMEIADRTALARLAKLREEDAKALAEEDSGDD